MCNLIVAGFERYRKNKWFWVILIGFIVVGLIGGMLTGKSQWGPHTEFFNIFFLIHLVLWYTYIMQEWSGGVIRNKITVGYKKSTIFLSEIVLHFCILLVLWFGFTIPYIIFIPSVLDIPVYQLGCVFVGIVLLCFSYITILITVHYLIPFKVGGVIVNVCLIYAVELGFLLDLDLQQMFPIEQAYMCFSYLVSYRIFKEYDLEILQHMEGLIYKYPIYSISFIILVGGIGILIFQRQDIK